MKKTALIFLLLLISASTFAQTTYPITQNLGSGSTLVNIGGLSATDRGGLKVRGMLQLDNYTDTTAANAVSYVKYYPGAMIRTGGEIIWVRSSDATRWITVGSSGSGTSTSTITILNDSTFIICNGNNVCDTITVSSSINNPSTVYFSSDTSIIVCATDTVTAVTTCDTLIIPRQLLSVYQNGVNSPFPGIVEWGGELVHDTEIFTQYQVIDFNGIPVQRYVTNTYQMQDWGVSTNIASFHGRTYSDSSTTELDFNNQVRIGFNYTGKDYTDLGGTIDWGYMQDKIGYWLGTNLYGAGSFGLNLDDNRSKFSGIFFHTFDTTNTDALTFFGNRPPLTTYYGDLNSSGNNLIQTRIMTLKYDGVVQFHEYPSSRNDGATSVAFYPDVDGNLKVGPISGSGGGTDNTNIGSGYRWLKPSGQEIKTFFVVGGTLDSTTNANALTLTVSGGSDTAYTSIRSFEDSCFIITRIDGTEDTVCFSGGGEGLFGYDDLIATTPRMFNAANNQFMIDSMGASSVLRTAGNQQFQIVAKNTTLADSTYITMRNGGTVGQKTLTMGLTNGTLINRFVTVGNIGTSMISENSATGKTASVSASTPSSHVQIRYANSTTGIENLIELTDSTLIKPPAGFINIDTLRSEFIDTNTMRLMVRLRNGGIKELTNWGGIGGGTGSSNAWTYDALNAPSGGFPVLGTSNNKSIYLHTNNVYRGVIDSTGKWCINCGAGNYSAATVSIGTAGTDGLVVLNVGGRTNVNGVLSGSFYRAYQLGQWEAMGIRSAGGATHLSIGGFISGQWTGVSIYVGATDHLMATSSGITISTLAGTGTRVTTASSAGLLGAIANTTDGFVLTLVGGAPAWAAATGGSGIDSVKAYNGLTAVGTDSVKIGGSLVENTTILNAGFSFTVSNNTATTSFTATNGSSGTGLDAGSSSGYGLTSQSVTGKSALLYVIPSSTNTVVSTVEVLRATTASPGDGIGLSIDLQLESDGSGNRLSNQLISKFTTVADATRTSQFIITGVNSAVTQNLLTLAGSGQLTLDQYTTSNFNGGVAADSVLVITSAGVVKKRDAAAFGGSSYTADNGITLASSNFKWGGTLTANTTINTGGFTSTFTGSNNGVAVLSVTNSNAAANSYAISASGANATATIHATNSSSGASISGVGTSGNGVYAESSSGIALQTLSTTNLGATFLTGPASTNSIVEAIRVIRATSGTAAAGLGGFIGLYAETTDGTQQEAARLAYSWTDATTASRTGDMQFWVTNNTTSALRMTLSSTGALVLTGRLQTDKGADVASANDLTLGSDGNVFVITGTTTINAITNTNWQAGSTITLIFTGATTVKHNTAGGAGTSRIFLAGSIDLTTANHTTLTLSHDGTQWQEASRKIP
jgi:hypothetical protein